MGKLINPGRLTSRVTLLRPSTPAVDELGGLQSVSYIPAKTLFARYESKNLSQQEFVGDYVTADTKYLSSFKIIFWYNIHFFYSWKLEFPCLIVSKVALSKIKVK